jgi:hypothetical protein
MAPTCGGDVLAADGLADGFQPLTAGATLTRPERHQE